MTVLYALCPGGQMKFHVLHDEQTKLYWLLLTEATDSMTDPKRMPAIRYNLRNNERRRLQLHFSRNMIDCASRGWPPSGRSSTPRAITRGWPSTATTW